MNDHIPGLKPEINAKIRKIFSDYLQVEKAILYGSRAKGTHRNYSDIDITLSGQKVDLDVVNKISRQIDELNLPWIFDISAMRQISNPDLKEHINRVGLDIYVRDDLVENVDI